MAINVENLRTKTPANGDAAAQPKTGATIEETSFSELTAMTDWYNPWQLIETAKKTLISTIIGENADPRLVGMPPKDGEFFDYSYAFANAKFEKDETAARDEIWIDYVSDVGDGFNPTYSVAYSLTEEKLDVSGNVLPRGEILIFGGDGVYPTATSDEYEKKLVKLYRMAFNAHRSAQGGDLRDLKTNPHVFALPGNHDWYDSLVAFQKIFCTAIFNNRSFAGGWQTRQTRSYFALKLPQNWWLLGIDLQLSHNIDVPQLQYFKSISDKMNVGDKVILCVPEPYWVKAIKYQDFDEAYQKLIEKETSVKTLEDALDKRGVETKLYVAGDLHHYRRFESHEGDKIQKITAGGGGAFLHPTHDFDYKKRRTHRETATNRRFELMKNYPEPDVSRSLDWKNLFGFIGSSPKFGILTAILYSLLALLIHAELPAGTAFSWREALKATINRFVGEPLALIVVILLLMGLVFFTDSNSKIYRRIAGIIHGLSHLTAVFFLGWLAYRLSEWIIDSFAIPGPTTGKLIWFGTILFVCGIGGYIAGAIIMGIYLFVSLRIFGRHDNEAFSALKIEDYKNFLRLHINKSGDLTIYPVKIEKVGREWDFEPNNGAGFYRPKTALATELIEAEPITIPSKDK